MCRGCHKQLQESTECNIIAPPVFSLSPRTATKSLNRYNCLLLLLLRHNAQQEKKWGIWKFPHFILCPWNIYIIQLNCTPNLFEKCTAPLPGCPSCHAVNREATAKSFGNISTASWSQQQQQKSRNSTILSTHSRLSRRRRHVLSQWVRQPPKLHVN